MLKSAFTTDKKAEMLFEYKQGVAGVVKNDAGELQLFVDNWGNPITDILGKDCSTLGREYTISTVKQQALNVGGVLTGMTVSEDNTTEVTITL